MAHHRLIFDMPAPADVVFVAFHDHQRRDHWDSLVGRTEVQVGAACPQGSANTANTASGSLRGISLRTRFVSHGRPRLAAAAMVGTAFPFSQWAASMHHEACGPDRSRRVYTCTFEVVGPRWGRAFLEPWVHWLFRARTRQRFARLGRFVGAHAGEVKAWQQDPQRAQPPVHHTAPGPAA